MLKEIVCDAFIVNNKPRGPIKFNKGLNTILGGAAAENSIGKSTFLLVIDFCFGGDTYSKSDIIDHVGNHKICFTFEFADGLHHYSRTISDPNHVNICNDNYISKETISIKKFREELLKGYNIQLYNASFRDIVSRFFRVAGKGNDSIINPLNNGSPSGSNAITSIEKLFNKYQYVESLKTKLDNAQTKKSTYTNARKLELVPNNIHNKTQYNHNKNLIEKLTDKKIKLTQNIDINLLEKDLNQMDTASDISCKLKTLKRQYGYLTSQYKNVTQNKEDHFIATEDDMQQLLHFFPSANIKHIEEVELFHKKLSTILNKELNDEEERLQLLIQKTTNEIQHLEIELNKLGHTLQIPTEFLKEYSDIERQISELYSQNEAYVKIQEFKKEEVEIKNQLIETEMSVLREIEDILNNQMLQYNDYIYDTTRESPTIHFDSKSKYTFKTPRDDGTGTAYKSLIVLDMSILKTTPLPVIAHDSSIFKNIGDEPIDRIMELYLQTDKQIFIAFDKDCAYNDRTSQIVNETAVLKLNPKGEELFGFCWATKNIDNT